MYSKLGHCQRGEKSIGKALMVVYILSARRVYYCRKLSEGSNFHRRFREDVIQQVLVELQVGTTRRRALYS